MDHYKDEKAGRMFMLEIENSAEYFPRKLNRQWLSSKQDKQMHGYGLKSVEDIIKRHGGVISYKTGDKKFTVIITLFD